MIMMLRHGNVKCFGIRHLHIYPQQERSPEQSCYQRRTPCLQPASLLCYRRFQYVPPIPRLVRRIRGRKVCVYAKSPVLVGRVTKGYAGTDINFVTEMASWTLPQVVYFVLTLGL